ncbi:MAG: phosphomethylpyrimidine synthase ThiC [Methanomassiliicoccales archaeon]
MSLMSEAAHRVTDEIALVAKKEGVDAERLRRAIAAGRVVIPHNPRHAIEVCGIGEGLTVKVNANIGTSRDFPEMEPELRKAKAAIEAGADAIMDLSTGGDIDAVRRAMLKASHVPLGTVPVYQAGLHAARRSAVVDMTEDDMFNGVLKHAHDGVDFMTIHCGINLATVQALRDSGRLMDAVSRGGSFLIAWMIHNQKENPFFAQFDYLLEMAEEHEFAISLGDGMRPGCLADATDGAQIGELMELGRLVQRCRSAGVQVFVEGPGHVPMDQIETNMRLEKALCDGAPFYVLGPLVTDIAPGYDHITAAIGGAMAAYYGADFLCYVTPAEHLSLPDLDDVREGVIASKIAAHAADVALGRGRERDDRMARARKRLDWEAMFAEALDPEKARRYRCRGVTEKQEGCSMCGDVCAMRIVEEQLRKK